MKRGMGMFVGWKERLFILTSKQLVYFEAGRLSALKGSLPLVRLRGLASACSPQRLRPRGVRRALLCPTHNHFDARQRDIKTFDMALPASRYGKRFCMSLSRASPTSPTWVLRTDSEADFIRWRDALHHAIDAARPLLPTPAARSALSPLASSAPNASNSKESSSARSSFFGLTETHPPLHPPAPSDSWSASAGMSSVASSIFNSTGSILQAGASMASLTLGGGLDDKQGNKPVQSKRSQSGRGSFPAVATANSAANSADVHGADDGYIEHNYTLGRVLERGSNGTVLAGVDKRTGEQVAIKVIDMDAGSIEDEGQKEIWLQVQHENMVRLLDYYRTDSKLYFIMELATGKDLFYGVVQHFHSAARPAGFSERDACDLTAQILTALRHLHLRRIVHCDLKPENILCYQHGGTLKLKLADWGFAQVAECMLARVHAHTLPPLFLTLSLLPPPPPLTPSPSLPQTLGFRAGITVGGHIEPGAGDWQLHGAGDAASAAIHREGRHVVGGGHFLHPAVRVSAIRGSVQKERKGTPPQQRARRARLRRHVRKHPAPVRCRWAVGVFSEPILGSGVERGAQAAADHAVSGPSGPSVGRDRPAGPVVSNSSDY